MKYLLTLLLFIGIIACSSTEQAIQDAVDQTQENYSEEENITESGLNLDDFRTQLSDAYAYRENKIPEEFNQIKVEQKEDKNLYEGYRIQIFSGEHISEADTIAADFRAWADTTITGYSPETYVFFRTPYYRVHVGDFHDREKAISFSNIVKRYFRDAWVVHDRVQPDHVPADTTVIQTQ